VKWEKLRGIERKSAAGGLKTKKVPGTARRAVLKRCQAPPGERPQNGARHFFWATFIQNLPPITKKSSASPLKITQKI